MHDVISTIFFNIYVFHNRKKYQLPLGGGIRNDCFSSVLPKVSKMSTYYVYN